MTQAYTPATIVAENKSFSIPLYQRLFEWDTENIEILLDDLYRAYKNSPSEKYHIGLLTSTANNELVDGQQRFTVLTLLACVLKADEYDSRWNDFLSPDNPRLRFQSRPQDVIYLKQVVECGFKNLHGAYKNLKMHNALETIDAKMSKIPTEEKSAFASFMFDHIAFFITELPDKYSPRSLNKYFERMNSSGKNLEQHEILKVKLLRNLDGNISPLMRLWNRIAEVDNELLRIRRHKNETEAEFSNRRMAILTHDIDFTISNELINGMSLSDSEGREIKSIRDIDAIETAPKREGATIRNSKSPLSFPMILLLTLYWKLTEEKTEGITLNEFFNPANLIETFEKYLPFDGQDNKNDIKDFLDRLLKARLILDYCFIRTSDTAYTLEMISEDDQEAKKLLMLESMLYVSSTRYTYYKWFNVLMNFICSCKVFPSADDLFAVLKKHDDESNDLPPYEALSYGAEIRYWFWRLDFYIWRHRHILFEKNPEALQVAENYRFVRARSIEHVAPQHPLKASSLQWEDNAEDESLRNSFGNLVMISNGLNSALKNQSYEIKKAHIEAYTHGSLSGSIESLSLLLLNSIYDTWDKEKIEEYGKLTYGFLEKSFD